MSPADKPLVWLRGEVKTPPFSASARVEAGTLLRRLQAAEKLQKTTQQTPRGTIDDCRRRVRRSDQLTGEEG